MMIEWKKYDAEDAHVGVVSGVPMLAVTPTATGYLAASLCYGGRTAVHQSLESAMDWCEELAQEWIEDVYRQSDRYLLEQVLEPVEIDL